MLAAVEQVAGTRPQALATVARADGNRPLALVASAEEARSPRLEQGEEGWVERSQPQEQARVATAARS